MEADGHTWVHPGTGATIREGRTESGSPGKCAECRREIAPEAPFLELQVPRGLPKSPGRISQHPRFCSKEDLVHFALVQENGTGVEDWKELAAWVDATLPDRP